MLAVIALNEFLQVMRNKLNDDSEKSFQAQTITRWTHSLYEFLLLISGCVQSTCWLQVKNLEEQIRQLTEVQESNARKQEKMKEENGQLIER